MAMLCWLFGRRASQKEKTKTIKDTKINAKKRERKCSQFRQLIITVRLVGIVVKSAIEISVTFQLFADAKGTVSATEVQTVIAIIPAAQFDLCPNGPESSTTSHFISRCKPVNHFTKIISDIFQNPLKLSFHYVTFMALPSERNISCSCLSFSPQISTGGSSSRFQTRTAAAAHPRAGQIKIRVNWK